MASKYSQLCNSYIKKHTNNNNKHLTEAEDLGTSTGNFFGGLVNRFRVLYGIDAFLKQCAKEINAINSKYCKYVNYKPKKNKLTDEQAIDINYEVDIISGKIKEWKRIIKTIPNFTKNEKIKKYDIHLTFLQNKLRSMPQCNTNFSTGKVDSFTDATPAPVSPEPAFPRLDATSTDARYVPSEIVPTSRRVVPTAKPTYRPRRTLPSSALRLK